MKIDYRTHADGLTTLEQQELVGFLHRHLDQYGDDRNSIQLAIDYALMPYPLAGGFILLAREHKEMIGALVMNKTGMAGYIPENILVYIAVHSDHRGKGIGKSLLKKAVGMAKGNIALHVEPENPARKLYEQNGFTNKYLEMRLMRTDISS